MPKHAKTRPNMSGGLSCFDMCWHVLTCFGNMPTQNTIIIIITEVRLSWRGTWSQLSVRQLVTYCQARTDSARHLLHRPSTSTAPGRGRELVGPRVRLSLDLYSAGPTFGLQSRDLARRPWDVWLRGGGALRAADRLALTEVTWTGRTHLCPGEVPFSLAGRSYAVGVVYGSTSPCAVLAVRRVGHAGLGAVDVAWSVLTCFDLL